MKDHSKLTECFNEDDVIYNGLIMCVNRIIYGCVS